MDPFEHPGHRLSLPPLWPPSPCACCRAVCLSGPTPAPSVDGVPTSACPVLCVCLVGHGNIGVVFKFPSRLGGCRMGNPCLGPTVARLCGPPRSPLAFPGPHSRWTQRPLTRRDGEQRPRREWALPCPPLRPLPPLCLSSSPLLGTQTVHYGVAKEASRLREQLRVHAVTLCQGPGHAHAPSALPISPGLSRSERGLTAPPHGPAYSRRVWACHPRIPGAPLRPPHPPLHPGPLGLLPRPALCGICIQVSLFGAAEEWVGPAAQEHRWWDNGPFRKLFRPTATSAELWPRSHAGGGCGVGGSGPLRRPCSAISSPWTLIRNWGDGAEGRDV